MSDRLGLGRLEFLGEALRATSAFAPPVQLARAGEARTRSVTQLTDAFPDSADDEELPSFVVSYELGPDWKAEDYKQLYRVLRSFRSWTWVLDSVWVLQAPDAEFVRDAIRPFLGESDGLLVMQVTKAIDNVIDRGAVAYRRPASPTRAGAVSQLAFG